jgi:hypothetical protein
MIERQRLAPASAPKAKKNFGLITVGLIEKQRSQTVITGGVSSRILRHSYVIFQRWVSKAEQTRQDQDD